MNKKTKEFPKIGVKAVCNPGIEIASGLCAGLTCPPGWWWMRRGKYNMCCHRVWDADAGDYVVKCKTQPTNVPSPPSG
jgi:hypothetical protein